MDHDELVQLLKQVQQHHIEVDEAIAAITRAEGQDDLGFARLDTARKERTGMSEVIFAPGKTDDQLHRLIERSLEHSGAVLVTRIGEDRATALAREFPELVVNGTGRLLMNEPKAPPTLARIGVVLAGTSDLPVAEEAAGTLEHLGHDVDRVVDVGVAGLHRLMSVRDRLMRTQTLIVVAGMEGALPSVVAGLVPRPVIAVPTSIGYGASFGGLAALLGMLNSCANGIGVVNIDNGFGAASLAHRITTGMGT